MKIILSGATAAMMLALLSGYGDDPKTGETAPLATLVIGQGQATAIPSREGSSRTGGGNIHVTQPAPDTLSVTMTGACVARPHPFKPSAAQFTFDLSQEFEVAFHSPQVKTARLVMWCRVIGLLRNESWCGKCGGSAEINQPGHAWVCCDSHEILGLTLPARGAACGQNLSIHDREGPIWVTAGPGKYTLHQVFGIAATQDKAVFAKPAAAEFAPDPAVESDWLSKREPFHGASKKDFGFQVILRIIPEENGDEPKSKPANAGAVSTGRRTMNHLLPSLDPQPAQSWVAGRQGR